MLDATGVFCYHTSMAQNKDHAVRLRIDRTTLASWREAATAAGLPLSAWIRIRCDGSVLAPQIAPIIRRKAV